MKFIVLLWTKNTTDAILGFAGSNLVSHADIIPSLGAASVAAAAASATIKSTSGLPLIPRLGVLAASTFTAAVSSKVGLGGKILSKNTVHDLIKSSSHADPESSRVPSPDMTLLHNIYEKGDGGSPLESLLLDLFTLNIVSLIVFGTIIFLVLYGYIFYFTVKPTSSTHTKIK